MASLEQCEELIKEYLTFRGFTTTLRTLEAEIKADKDKGLRPDKIVEQFVSYITGYELLNLRSYWAYLQSQIFCQLEKDFSPIFRKLEVSLLRFYLINAIQTNRPEKVSDFFEKLSSELQSQSEWKDWFALPFIQNPQENRDFSLYFTKQWQDKLLLCLHNFLSVVFQAMPMPTLSSFQEHLDRIQELQDETVLYKQQVSDLLRRRTVDHQSGESSNRLAPTGQNPVVPKHITTQIPDNIELIDDFSALEVDNLGKEKVDPNQSSKGSKIKSFIGIMPGIMRPSSPGFMRKRYQSQTSKDEPAVPSKPKTTETNNVHLPLKPLTPTVQQPTPILVSSQTVNNVAAPKEVFERQRQQLFEGSQSSKRLSGNRLSRDKLDS